MGLTASNRTFACSSERNVHLWSDKRETPIKLEHQSVGGLAFGRRLAVSHYGGVTVWERTKRRWKSTALVWKGFHGAPDGKYVGNARKCRLETKAILRCLVIQMFRLGWRNPFLTTSGTPRFVGLSMASLVQWSGLRFVSLKKTPNFLPMCKVCQAKMQSSPDIKTVPCFCQHQ